MFRLAINDRIPVSFTALLLLAAAQPATAQQLRITPPPETTENRPSPDHFGICLDSTFLLIR